jgi:hypothetical protein
MKEVQCIGFIPPVEGVDQEFNTFRLGGTLAKALTVGEDVFLMDEKKKRVFGRAVVLRVEVGKLRELCNEHAHSNHRELMNPPEGAGERLFTYLQKIFGPHIAPPTKKACVIYLKRME